MQSNIISVIIPVYNAEKWINKCLDSIISQTIYNKLEIIIVDDGSTDNSANIIEAYEKVHNNVKCFYVNNSGVSSARNIGLDHCSGKYITFVDADDYLDPAFFENLINSVDEKTDIVCSGFIAEYPYKNIKRCADQKYEFNNKEAMYQFLLGGILEPNVTDKLFRSSVIENLRFNTSIDIAEDKLFLFECLKQSRNIKLIPVANYHYVMNDLSACRKDFSITKFDSTIVADLICEDIKTIYPEYIDLSESMAIDVKCRVYGEMFYTKSYECYKEEYLKLKSEIRKFSIKKKYINSNKKHFLSFIVVRIHPALYCFLKNKMKLQYKNISS